MTVLCALYSVAQSAVTRNSLPKILFDLVSLLAFLQEIKESTQTKLVLVLFKVSPTL